MICDECKDERQCRHHCVTVKAPLTCVPCKFCGSREQLYAEIPVMGDWFYRGFVMRIGCLCEQQPWPSRGDKDEARTEFEPYQTAIDQWNAMMREA